MSSSHNPSNHFIKVTPVRIFEQATDQIKQLIIGGHLEFGEKLPTEQELSEQFNVSRSSIREALRVLETEGIIEIRRGQGAFIAEPSLMKRDLNNLSLWLQQRKDTLAQVLQVRESIEGLSASLAAKNASQESLQIIRELLKKQTKLINLITDAGSNEIYKEICNLDVKFHLAISAASGNDIVHEIVTRIVPPFNESNKAILCISKRMRLMQDEHHEILLAIEEHDPALAEKAMRLHISRVKNVITMLPEPETHGY